MRIVPFEKLSRFQRRATPLALCRHLVDRVSNHYGSATVAVLWIERKSHYWKLWPAVELHGVGRDARRYSGPFPVICHPPCGPWGKYKANCNHNKEDAIIAMELVHRWGGVVEHPVGSSLFMEHGLDGVVERINQADFGHMAMKPTLLYWVLK